MVAQLEYAKPINHREAIEAIFGIVIKCDRRTNKYSINYPEDAMDESSSTRWLINTFAVKNVLDLGKERLSGRVSVEEAPSGEKNLLPLMKAMEEMMEVEIEYQKYKSTSSELLHVQPFALKQDKQRWYLAGYCEERAISKEGNRSPNSDIRAWRVYSLDRIMSVKQTEVTFSLPGGFDVDDCFAQSYGPYLPNDGRKAVTIRFRASDSEAKYLRDLPLHKSQKEESRKKDSEQKIINTVADYYNLAPYQIQGNVRTSQIAMARHISMYLIRVLMDVPFQKIGRFFGGKDHATVMNGVNKVEKSLKTDTALSQAVNELKARLKNFSTAKQ